jgi:hypothetical protein
VLPVLPRPADASDDPARKELVQARAACDLASDRADTELLRVLKRIVEYYADLGDIDQVNVVLAATEKLSLDGAADLEGLPTLRRSREIWANARRVAYLSLVAAFHQAIKAHTMAREFDRASALKRELELRGNGTWLDFARLTQPRTVDEWESLPGVIFRVPGATNEGVPLVTDIEIGESQKLFVAAHPGDQWAKGGGTKKGVLCNFRGYPGRGNWMRMMVRVGEGEKCVVNDTYVFARQPGKLVLFANDDKPRGNHGFIRVKILIGG